MKKEIYFLFLMTIVIICCNWCCNSTSKNEIFSKEHRHIREFVTSYSEYVKSTYDTANIFIIFAETNINKSKYYIRADKSTSFIEDNPPLFCFAFNNLSVFLYTGLEKTFFVTSNTNTDCHIPSNRQPLVYDPPTWCMTVVGDSIYIDKKPSLSDREEATDQPRMTRNHIIFKPPKVK